MRGWTMRLAGAVFLFAWFGLRFLKGDAVCNQFRGCGIWVFCGFLVAEVKRVA